MLVFKQKWLYSGKVVVFGESGCILDKSCCILAKFLYSGQKWFYSCKSGCIRAELLYSGKCGCIRAKVVVFGQSGCIQAKVVVFEKSGCIQQK